MNIRRKTYQHTKENDIETIPVYKDDNVSVEIETFFNAGAFLLTACEEGNLQQAQQMLDQGTNPNVADLNGMAGLYVAAQNGHVEIVKLLLAHRADPNKSADLPLKTPLFAACGRNQNEIVSLLIAAGANINELNSDKCTPMMAATLADNITAVEKLLLAGASVSVEGQICTPLQLAKSKQRMDIAKLLAIHEGLLAVKKQDPKSNCCVRFRRDGSKPIFTIFALTETKDVVNEDQEKNTNHQASAGIGK